MIATEIKVDDLIGRRYVEGAHDIAAGPLDCAGACAAVLLRGGELEAAASVVSPQPESGYDSSGWTRIADGVDGRLPLLAVIVSKLVDGHVNVACVHSEKSQRALTSVPERGVCSLPIRAIGSVEGVYTWGER